MKVLAEWKFKDGPDHYEQVIQCEDFEQAVTYWLTEWTEGDSEELLDYCDYISITKTERNK